MNKFRNIFFGLASGFARNMPLPALHALSGNKTIFPFYHIVSNQYEPHIANLYAYKDEQKFERDIDFLLKHYKPLDLKQLQNNVSGNKKIDFNSFYLSFDDGLKSFYEVIAPILFKKGIQAACFLNSDFIDNKALFFRYKASLLIDYISSGKLSASTLEQVNLKLKEYNFTDEDIVKNLLAVKYNQAFVLDELAEIMEYDYKDFLTENKPYLTSAQIKELKEQGFIFGAHSIDHPEYRFLTLEQQLFQTRKSLEIIKQQFSLTYSIFSFPFTDFDVSDEFFKNLYADEQVDLTFGCAGIKSEIYTKHIQRLSMEQADFSAEEIIKTELLYNICRKAVGKHKIIRQ